MERFFTDSILIQQQSAFIKGDELKHLAKVLRMKPDDPVEVFDGQGQGFRGKISSISDLQAEVIELRPVEQIRESSLKICLVQGIPKGEKMEWVVQKATELGAQRIIPLESMRSVVKLTLEKKRLERQSRWQKVAAEAARQCGRVVIPEVDVPMSLINFLQIPAPTDTILVPWEEGGLPLKEVLRQDNFSQRSQEGWIYIVIGPEGGLAAEEVGQMRDKGGLAVTLGPRILRTETAGIACISILQYEWGDMGA